MQKKSQSKTERKRGSGKLPRKVEEMKTNAIRQFDTREEAERFAKEVKSPNWGWEKDCKTGEIVRWYVDFYNEEWAKVLAGE